MKKNEQKDPSRFIEPSRTTNKEIEYRLNLESYFDNSVGSSVEKLQNFAKYVPDQEIRKFIARYELFNLVKDIHGSIVECGVLFGGGLMTWARLSEIFEPINHLRKIIGFDTFSGFASISDNRDASLYAVNLKEGGLAIDTYKNLQDCIKLYDSQRLLKHINKVVLVKGDATDTIPKFVQENPYLIISLLWLDFDLYEPTKVALTHLFPRIPKGGIIVFDELNHEVWPGETVAVEEVLGINNLSLRRFPFGGTLSYAVVE